MKKLALLLGVLFVLSSLAACAEPQPAAPPQQTPAEQNDNGLGQTAFMQAILQSAENQDNITPELRQKYNLMARDFYFCYLPEFNDYAQAVEAAAGPFVFYTLWPVQENPVPQYEIEQKLAELFVGFEQAPPFVHQDFGRYAWYEDGCYTLPPEGCPDFKREFYLLTSLEVKPAPDGSDQIYVFCTATNYYFNDIEVYEPGPDELWLHEQATALGLDDLEAAKYLLADGSLSELEPQIVIQTVLVIDNQEQTAKILSNNYL